MKYCTELWKISCRTKTSDLDYILLHSIKLYVIQRNDIRFLSKQWLSMIHNVKIYIQWKKILLLEFLRTGKLLREICYSVVYNSCIYSCLFTCLKEITQYVILKVVLIVTYIPSRTPFILYSQFLLSIE